MGPAWGTQALYTAPDCDLGVHDCPAAVVHELLGGPGSGRGLGSLDWEGGGSGRLQCFANRLARKASCKMVSSKLWSCN